jgi:hypothetical protein
MINAIDVQCGMSVTIFRCLCRSLLLLLLSVFLYYVFLFFYFCCFPAVSPCTVGYVCDLINRFFQNYG